MEYITRENDTVDLICYRVYGHHQNQIMDKVISKNIEVLTKSYEKNPDSRGKLPAGLILEIPDKPGAVQLKQVRRLF